MHAQGECSNVHITCAPCPSQPGLNSFARDPFAHRHPSSLPCSLTFFFALNALANYDPYQRWRIRLEYFARKLGCAEDINATDQWEGEG